MKKVLGLDLGTNSIGWALVNIDHSKGIVKVLGLGSRILPMDAQELKDFEGSGKIKSTAAQRTVKRGPRRLNERYLLRRDRLHLVLNLLKALPEHYRLEIDFKRNGKKSGKFKKNKEPKLAYLPKQQGGKASFLFMDSYQEMLNDINHNGVGNVKGKRIPFDWTLYYLRTKALKEEITLEELAWVLLSYNQKRGYEKTEVEDRSAKEGEVVEELDLQVKDVYPKSDEDGQKYFEVHLEGNDEFCYKEYSAEQMTFKGDLKEIIKISVVDGEGNTDHKKTLFSVVDIYPLTIKQVEYEKDNGKHKYTLTYHNGWQETKSPSNYTYKYNNAFNNEYDYIVETTYDHKGDIKTQQGKQRKLREPDLSEKSSDWTLLKKKTEKEALAFNIDHGFINDDKSAKSFISPKIYDVLKSDAKSGGRTKIIGGMFQVVDRDFYREELNQIITTQKQHHQALVDEKLFEQCVDALYPKNKNHQKALLKNKLAIQHLLTEDILLYQRPLKSKKSEIGNCKYEVMYWEDLFDKDDKPILQIDIESGEETIKKRPIFKKAVSTSHPYFQEFRIWDKLHNLKLIQLEKEVDGKKLTNQDVTKEYFKGKKEYQALFEKLNNKKSLTQEQFLTYCKGEFGIDYKKKESKYAWNFPEDDEIKGNETRVSFAMRFKRCGFSDYATFLTQEKERDLWHYLFSVSYKEREANDRQSTKSFFNKFFKDIEIDHVVLGKIIADFVKYPKFASRYCAYSEKSLKKLIPLMHMGNTSDGFAWQSDKWYKVWQQSNENRKSEIIKRISGIDFSTDDLDWKSFVDNTAKVPFPKGLFSTFKSFERIEDFTSLNLTQASYLVYGRHSELAQAKYWTSPEDIRSQLHQELKQHSLNNPVAEKVILEMMQIVADIWEYYGVKEKETDSPKRPFDRIHVEVGRELKKSVKEKEKDTKRMSASRTQNKRIRQVLEEFLADKTYKANPLNFDHFERLKIAEEGAAHTKNTDKEFFNGKTYNRKEIEDILKKPRITRQDFEKYKLWVEQGYRSPYSGQMIRLTELFDGNKFNVDHIFPQAKITNDSLSNKVVVEVALNQLKSDQTARSFIQTRKGQPYLGIPVCTEEQFISIVKAQFSGTKRMILLSKDIPKGFTNSQMNNARHIARKAMELLSHTVRVPGEIEFRSKNVLPVTGRITSELKRAWKLNEVWTELVSPRFIRLNELTQSSLFGKWQVAKNGKEYFDCNLDEAIREKDDSYDIKRIDHRHHALDALIVALCTEDHVNYLNNINADSRSEDYGKQRRIEKYRETLKRKIKFTKNENERDEKNWHYMLPGQIRKTGSDTSRIDSVLEKSYQYKDFDSFGLNYKKMILVALQDTVVTFKQNLRVINSTINKYNNTPNKNTFVKQKGSDEGNKKSWAIRRSLGKDSFYGKKTINGIAKIVIRKKLDESFDSDKIKTITDTRIRKILCNQLRRFDTVQLPFVQATKYYEALMERQEIEAIVKDVENDFRSVSEFFAFLAENEFKFNKTDYSELNIFIENVSDVNFREEDHFSDRISEHPEIAFTPEAIEKMNQPDELKNLNDGKRHAPIRKVRISRGYGNQRALNPEDKHSVKSKQYVVNDAGSNLYLGVYERHHTDEHGNEVRERKFKDIGLIELIETLKQDKDKRHHPLPEVLYDNTGNEFGRLFTLSPLDLVYVPNDEEVDNPRLVDFENLSVEQMNRIYKYIDGGFNSKGILQTNFVPFRISKAIKISNLKSRDKKFNGEITLTTDKPKQQKTLEGYHSSLDEKKMIREECWKLKVDRLGVIKGAIK